MRMSENVSVFFRFCVEKYCSLGALLHISRFHMLLKKWIKGLTRQDDDNKNSKPPALDSFMDTMAWVRSMQEE